MIKIKIQEAFKDTLPVLAGYFVLGAGFAIIMKSSGYGIRWSLAMSVFIYAGSMQYAAIGLITGGASLITVALTTFAVNARHLFYGVSMVDKYRNTGVKKPYLIFALTDETYSLVCSCEKDNVYIFLVSLFNHIYWITGTVFGSILGNVMTFNTKGIDFALTALFITVFTEQWINSKNHFFAFVGVAISVLCLLLFGANSFLIPSMAGISAILLLKMRKEKLHDK